jgi:hypothetical protein
VCVLEVVTLCEVIDFLLESASPVTEVGIRTCPFEDRKAVVTIEPIKESLSE